MHVKKCFLIVLTILIVLSPAAADLMHSPTWGYGLDLPEGFELLDKNGNDAYMFEHSELPVSVIVRAYPTSRYATPAKAMENVMKSLEQNTTHQTLHGATIHALSRPSRWY